ncbi:hypothetical protein L7F22_036637 [Adiantum nelumboides]|nr:hypothetical protein [Adiantum nelumboides]
MKTGEGKTLVSTLPAYLNAISGEGVHLVTVNDYLAQRDSMDGPRAPVPRPVGRAIYSDMSPTERRKAYQAEHHLRHQQRARLRLPARQHGRLHRRVRAAGSQLRRGRRGRLDPHRRGPHPADHLGAREQSARWYSEFARLAPKMNKDEHYEVDERKRTVGVTEDGVAFIRGEDHLGIENLYESANTPLISFLNNSIKAKELFFATRTTIVRDGEVLIVDEFTGRVLAGRATTRVCTRRSRPRKASRSRPRTRRSPRSRCRTSSGSTRSSRG